MYVIFLKLKNKKIINEIVINNKKKFKLLFVSKSIKIYDKKIKPEFPFIPSAMFMLFKNNIIKSGVIKYFRSSKIKVLSNESKKS
jgi:hypothetical protein